MTRVLSMNADRDIHAIGGRLQIATGLEAVRQNCERAMRAVLGEMIYANERGVDYFDTAFGNSPDVVRFTASARAQLARVQSVTSIESFEAAIRSGTMQYTATIRTEFGTTTITNTESA